MKAYQGMNSCGVELKEIRQHWLRRRDVIRCNIVQAYQSRCICSTYFEKSQHCMDDIV